MVIRDYYAHIVNKVGQNSQYCADWNAIKFTSNTRVSGFVYANSLKFKDGSFLRFQEWIEIDKDDVIHRPPYSYHYQSPADKGAFYFNVPDHPARTEQ